jgi:hypothetical protein
MACCGQNRAIAAASNGRVVGTNRPPKAAPRREVYEYTGATGMTVVGPLSGQKYRFDQPGSKLQIDVRDVPSMTGLPNLRRL